MDNIHDIDFNDDNIHDDGIILNDGNTHDTYLNDGSHNIISKGNIHDISYFVFYIYIQF